MKGGSTVAGTRYGTAGFLISEPEKMDAQTGHEQGRT